MIHGPTMCRAKPKRTAVETATIAATQAHAGTARAVSRTDSDLPETLDEERRVAHARLGCGLRHAPENGVIDGGPACCDLECRDVRVCHSSECMLCLDVAARRVTELRC